MLQNWATPTSRCRGPVHAAAKAPRVAIPVTIIPNMTHTDMIGSPVALREVARAIVRQE
jgi:hypothetical protein